MQTLRAWFGIAAFIVVGALLLAPVLVTCLVIVAMRAPRAATEVFAAYLGLLIFIGEKVGGISV